MSMWVRIDVSRGYEKKRKKEIATTTANISAAVAVVAISEDGLFNVCVPCRISQGTSKHSRKATV